MEYKYIFNNGDIINGVSFIEEIEPKIVSGREKRMAKLMCDCGSVFTAELHSVRYGKCMCCSSCLTKRRCENKKNINIGDIINGNTFIRELEPTYKNGRKYRIGEFKCRCGNIYEAKVHDVRKGSTKSCGCYKKDVLLNARRIHGLTHTKIYGVWLNMKQRCYSEKDKAYADYGGRGIIVSEEFKDNAAAFLDYVMSLPDYGKKGYTIDRIDNNGNYERGNLRWADRSTQSLNKRKYKSNTAGYTGVYYIHKKWYSFISHHNERKWICFCDTPEEAAIARDKYIVENNLPHKLSGLSIPTC